MKLHKEVIVKLEPETYDFYNDIAKCVNRPVEDILSVTLYKCVDILTGGPNKS